MDHQVSFFPAGFDPRADLVGALELVKINTSTGVVRLMSGIDGRFTDTLGVEWIGSTLLSAERLEMALGGRAPAGQLTFSFFQDPLAPDLISQMRALGADHVRNRPVTFLVQPLLTYADLHQPQVAPIEVAQRRMTSITTTAEGPITRAITLTFEGTFAGRNTARRWTYTTEDHARLVGGPNPSLQFMPKDDFQEEKLFG
jgi:hypothetical protein